MANIMDLLFSGGDGARAAEAALKKLDKDHTVVRVEIENTQIRFQTVLSVRRGIVIFARPKGLREGIRSGGYVRVSVPDAGRDLRMEVIASNFNLSSGSTVFMCKLPTAFVAGPHRSDVRFNTSRFSSLSLVLPQRKMQYRVLDLSVSGCKVMALPGSADAALPAGERIAPALIDMGKVQVELDHVVPRVHRGTTVGCTFEVRHDGNSLKYLTHLLRSLEKEENERFSADASM